MLLFDEVGCYEVTGLHKFPCETVQQAMSLHNSVHFSVYIDITQTGFQKSPAHLQSFALYNTFV